MNTVLRRMLNRYPWIKDKARKLISAIPLSTRLGNDFWLWYSFFEDSEYWASEEIVYYQMGLLKDLLWELKRTSMFYKKLLSNVNINSINTLSSFQSTIPTLSRSQFRDNYTSILSHNLKNQSITKSQTSGTTGNALQFYYPEEDEAREWAAICHQWKRVGFVPGKTKRVEFRGLTTHGAIINYFPDLNKIRCSILHLKREHIYEYACAIRKSSIKYYHGYPSALYLLSKCICNNEIDFPQPHAIMLASEIVYDWQISQIKTAFPYAKIFAHYGCAERTVLAGWCEYRNEYHVLPLYSLVEVDSENSEIIGTNLFNHINGFVRYRMKDTALKVSLEPCPDCSRPYTPILAQIGGRTEDYIYSVDKGWIPPAILTYPLKSLNVVKEIQFYQQKREELVIRYTLPEQIDDNSVSNELDSIKSGLRTLLGDDINLKLRRVDDFERGATGKFKWIISELDFM